MPVSSKQFNSSEHKKKQPCTCKRSTAVVLNLFAEGSQIQTYDFFEEPH